VDVDLTLTEATTLMNPTISEPQLRAIIRALHIPHTGTRPNGHPGRPALTYPASQLMQLHAALVPWLGITYSNGHATHLSESVTLHVKPPAEDMISLMRKYRKLNGPDRGHND
jgi:hypothetical protein